MRRDHKNQRNDGELLEGQEEKNIEGREGGDCTEGALNGDERILSPIDCSQPEHRPSNTVNAEGSPHLEAVAKAASDPNRHERIIISFPSGDPENPYNWSTVGLVVVSNVHEFGS